MAGPPSRVAALGARHPEVIKNPADDPNVQGDEVLTPASDRDYGLSIFRDP